MDNHVSSESELRLSEQATVAPPRPDPETFPAATGGGGARYKLMSPAKLPISRSPCLTIPPGLSPTSFLESPVLLSNVKPEPSPTTGSFTKPPAVQDSDYSLSFSTATVSSNPFAERKSSFFEFRPYSGPNMVSGDLNLHKNEHSVKVLSQCTSQPFSSSTSVKSEMALPSSDLSLSAPLPLQMVTSVPAEFDSEELNETDELGPHHKGGNGPLISSDDGYNWRKYGQKHVKGSEFPRSYYKCTHPNCEVKKLFERSHDGQITEIIYKGTHDHPKPQPSRRYNNTGGAIYTQEERSDNVIALSCQDDKSSHVYGQVSQTIEQNGSSDKTPVATNDDGIEFADEDEDPILKRRRMETGAFDVTPVVKPIREPRVVVQTVSEVDILDDGYRWRKYGQKVVRGNPNPRSYYKCTYTGCPVRKHVERASHDPKAVITTYEGKHNHNVPTTRTSSHETAGGGASSVNGLSRMRSDENKPAGLDLGVGMISLTGENRSNDQQQGFHPRMSGSGFNIGPIPPYYGVLHGGSVEIAPVNHSTSYPPNTGRLLTGP